VTVQLGAVADRQDTINAVADVKEAGILFPDPAMKIRQNFRKASCVKSARRFLPAWPILRHKNKWGSD
jgi:hypothetical protein